MIGRFVLVTGLFAALGAGIALRPVAKPYKIDEGWLERQYPTNLGPYATVPDPDDGSTMHSYRMDDVTYKTLKPYGIVGRVLTDGKQAYDVVTLAGDSPESFHNPLQCFAAQEWTVKEPRQITIQTKSRGEVHATIAEATRSGGSPQYALYTYESPLGMCANPPDLGKDLLKATLMSGKVQIGTFFRFMSRTPNISENQMIDFARQYLDASPVRPILSLKS